MLRYVAFSSLLLLTLLFTTINLLLASMPEKLRHSNEEAVPSHSRQNSRSLDNNDLPSASRQIENGEHSTPQYMNHVMSRFGHHLSAREWSLFSQSMVPMLQSSSPGSTQQRNIVSGTPAGISLPPSSLEVTRSLSTPPIIGATAHHQSLLPHIKAAFQGEAFHNHPNPSSSSSSSKTSKQMDLDPNELQHYKQQDNT